MAREAESKAQHPHLLPITSGDESKIRRGLNEQLSQHADPDSPLLCRVAHISALNPAFGMTSNHVASPQLSPTNCDSENPASRRSLRDAGTVGAGNVKVKRNHKSSDRLHRLGGGTGTTSSTQLSSKRSKSQTSLAPMNNGIITSPTRSSSKAGKKRSSVRRGASEPHGLAEEGWTSASAESETTHMSRTNSPDRLFARKKTLIDSTDVVNGGGEKHEDKDEDEGLTIGVNRHNRGKILQRQPSAPGSNRREGSSSSMVTVKAPVVPGITRSDTSSLLVGVQDRHEVPREARPITERQEQSAVSAAAPSTQNSIAPRLLDASKRISFEETLPSDAASSQAGAHTSMVGQASPLRGQRTTSPLSQSRATKGSGVNQSDAPRHGHLRLSSSASSKTVTGSSASISSRLSVRARPHSFMHLEHHGAAPPMLSMHNALAGHLGALYESQPAFDGAPPSRPSMGSGVPSASGPVESIAQESNAHNLRRKASISSQGSAITLPAGFTTIGDASKSPAGRESLPLVGSRGQSVTDSAQSPSVWERKRAESTKSLTAADAAKLAAKLRRARDAIDEQLSLSAGGGSAFVGGNGRQFDGKQAKPVISIFEKEQERRGNPVAVTVASSSVFSPNFTRAIAHQQSPEQEEGARRATAFRISLANQIKAIRYVGMYGLSGPPIEKNPLNDALLAPSFDGDEFEASWAPALANAAGLGARSFFRFGGAQGSGAESGAGCSSEFFVDRTPFQDPTLAFSGSAAVNGPNATPVHLIHGLTAISPEPFPLDATDAPSFHPSQCEDGHDQQQMVMSQQGVHGLTADPATLRAIALTSQVLSTHRSHSMTRRFFNPMNEALNRLLRASVRYRSLHGGRQSSGEAVSGLRTVPSSPRGKSSSVGSHPLSERTSSAGRYAPGRS